MRKIRWGEIYGGKKDYKKKLYNQIFLQGIYMLSQHLNLTLRQEMLYSKTLLLGGEG